MDEDIEYQEEQLNHSNKSYNSLLYLAVGLVVGGIIVYSIVKNKTATLSLETNPTIAEWQPLSDIPSADDPLYQNCQYNQNYQHNQNYQDQSQEFALLSNTVSNVLSVQKLQLQESSKMNQLLDTLSQSQIMTTKRLLDLQSIQTHYMPTQQPTQKLVQSQKQQSTKPEMVQIQQNDENVVFNKDSKGKIQGFSFSRKLFVNKSNI